MERKNILLHLTIILLSTGCLGSDFLIPNNPSRKNTLTRKEQGSGSEADPILPDSSASPIPHSIYYTAIEYPVLYDWHSDSARGIVEFNLVGYKDGEKLITIPSSPIIKSEPALHRLYKGSIYSEARLGTEMVISKDGKTLFKYFGDEVICGLIVKDEALYTIGQNKKGHGFCLRKNGTILFESCNGFVYGGFSESSNKTGALYIDHGKLCFVYYYPNNKWYYYDGGQTNEINTYDSLSTIVGARIINGTVVTVGTSGNHSGSYLKLLTGTQEDILLTTTSLSIDYCQILFRDNKVLVRVEGSRGGEKFGAIFPKVGKPLISSSFLGINCFCFNKYKTSYAIYHSGMKKITSFIVGEREIELTPPMFLASPFCMDMNEQHIYFALSPNKPKGKPILWDNGQLTELDINGYLTNIEIVY